MSTTVAAPPARARRRHRQHGNPFSLRGDVVVPSYLEVYGREAPFALEVGFGGGSFLIGLGRAHPEWNVLGVEIRQHFVDDANAAAAAQGLKNVHAVRANANAHLAALLPPASVVFVSINFPDPWFKKRHQKRRVVQPEWVQELATHLMPGAEVHAMTDFEPGGRQILEVFAAAASFVNTEGAGRFAEASTTGIESERERTHVRRGEPIYRLRFRFEPG